MTLYRWKPLIMIAVLALALIAVYNSKAPAGELPDLQRGDPVQVTGVLCKTVADYERFAAVYEDAPDTEEGLEQTLDAVNGKSVTCAYGSFMVIFNHKDEKILKVSGGDLHLILVQLLGVKVGEQMVPVKGDVKPIVSGVLEPKVGA